jgi:hypothetical protein
MKFTMEWVWNCIINKKTDKATRWCPAEDDLVLFLQGTLASRYAVPLEDIQRFRCIPYFRSSLLLWLTCLNNIFG